MAAVADPPIQGQQDIDGSEAGPAPLDQVTVDGTVQLGLFDGGGKHPTSATLTLPGGTVPLTHGKAFNKGDTVVFQVVAVICEIGQKDKLDKPTGIAIECVQTHKAKLTDIQLIDHS